MTHTVDSLMELVYDYADEYANSYKRKNTSYSRRTARKALLAALTEVISYSDVSLINEGNKAQPVAVDRQAFESWAVTILGDNPTWRESAECEFAWQAWQAAQPVREPLTDAQITTIAHRMATKYTHRSDPTSHAYGFVKHTLIDFVKAIERAHGIGGDK